MSFNVHSHVDTTHRVAVITTDFDHPVETVWSLWSDPAKLARWWGPPGMPMTVEHHDLRPAGSVTVAVHLPTGTIRGNWRVHTVDPPHGLTFTFASDGIEPTDIEVSITPTSPATSQMTITARFASDQLVAHAIDIGFAEGVARACGAAIELLAEQS